MAFLRENTFEGGTDGVAVSTANSGGASGNAFGEVSGTAFTYSNVQAHLGSLSMRNVNPAGNAYAAFTGLGALTGSVYCRFYMHISAAPVTTHLYAIRVMDDNFESMAFLRVLTGAAGGFITGTDWLVGGVANGSVPVATAQWVRIEFRIVYGTTTGEFEWRLYNTADSTTITDTASATGIATAAGTGTGLGDVRLGFVNGVPASPFTVYYDDFAVDTAGWIGPAAVGPTQAVLPDADTTTTGWTTTPLFSKINDASDATVITSTLA